MPNEAQLLALRWLSQRSLSIREVNQRLDRRGLDPEEIAAAIEALKRLGYLDDLKLSQQIAEKSVARHEGPARLAARLAQRGVSPETSRQVSQALAQETDWLAIAEPLRERYDMSSPKGRLRFIRHLAREGFPAAVIYRLAGERSDDTDGVDDY